MSAPISVVIPTLNSAKSLPATLLSLMEGLDAGLICEVVVTDGGSTDSSGAIAMAWGAEVVIGAASRGGQLRRGVAATRGAWVMVLHADTILQEGWAEQVKARMQQGPLCFSLAFRARGLAPRGWRPGQTCAVTYLVCPTVTRGSYCNGAITTGREAIQINH